MTTKWGIVGTGNICHDFVTCLRSLKSDEHNVVAVASRSLESAKQFAEIHKIQKTYGSYEELAKDNEIEVAYIGTLTSTHFTLTKLFINSGKHVLVEKPITMTSKRLEELIQLAKEKQRFLMEAIWSRFFPAYKFCVEQIKSGAIGDVLHIRSQFAKKSTKERICKKSLGGGVMFDYGVYAINVIQMIFKEKPEEIKAIGFFNEECVDTSVSVVLKYSNGRSASFETMLSLTLPNEAEYFGTTSMIKIASPFWCPEKITVSGDAYDFKLPPTILSCNFQNSSGLRYEAEEVRNCLKKGLLESPILPLNDSLIIREITDEILRQIGVKFEE